MNEVEEELLQLKGYGYQIWSYIVGHSILIFQGRTSDERSKNIRLNFNNVHYFQFPRGWFGDFYIASDTEWREIMTRAGLNISEVDKVVPASLIKGSYQLYKADSPNGIVYALGHLAQIEYDV